jgi:hypothetical protein
MIICVQTFKLHKGKDDEFESEWFMNDERGDARQRLAKHCFWAHRNGRSVTTFPKGY